MRLVITKNVACKRCKQKNKKHHARGYCKACYAALQRAKK